MLQYRWSCSCCGQQFDELPLHWGVEAPVYYEALPDAERQTRAELTTDFCVIDGCYFFIRGQIEIPIIGSSETLTYTVWASLSAASVEKVQSVWSDPDRNTQPPFFGWLSSALPLYPDTVGLKTHVHLRAPPIIPTVELEPTDHPLAIEQRNGITLERAVEIAAALLPPH